MPKIKTHSSAKKRFSITGSGKVKAFHANKSHLLGKRSKSRKLRLAGSTLVDVADQKRVKVLLGIN
jgi:large subunit ribosomal protein L35